MNDTPSDSATVVAHTPGPIPEPGQASRFDRLCLRAQKQGKSRVDACRAELWHFYVALIESMDLEYADMAELAAAVEYRDPARAHTLSWDVHPEGWDDMCYCYECRSYS